MLSISIDAAGFGAACGGLAALVTAFSYLVWAFRRDPKGRADSGSSRQLPTTTSDD